MKNPQAFPMVIPTAEPNTIIEGMTLRDYFAAAALTGIRAANEDDFSYEAIAATCYQQADAMLKARGK